MTYVARQIRFIEISIEAVSRRERPTHIARSSFHPPAQRKCRGEFETDDDGFDTLIHSWRLTLKTKRMVHLRFGIFIAISQNRTAMGDSSNADMRKTAKEPGISSPLRPQELPFTAQERVSVTILFGGLTWKHERLTEGLLSGAGYLCQRLPETDRAAHEIAQEYCASGLCNPVYFTVGNLLRYLRRLQDSGLKLHFRRGASRSSATDAPFFSSRTLSISNARAGGRRRSSPAWQHCFPRTCSFTWPVSPTSHPSEAELSCKAERRRISPWLKRRWISSAHITTERKFRRSRFIRIAARLVPSGPRWKRWRIDARKKHPAFRDSSSSIGPTTPLAATNRRAAISAPTGPLWN